MRTKNVLFAVLGLIMLLNRTLISVALVTAVAPLMSRCSLIAFGVGLGVVTSVVVLAISSNDGSPEFVGWLVSVTRGVVVSIPAGSTQPGWAVVGAAVSQYSNRIEPRLYEDPSLKVNS